MKTDAVRGMTRFLRTIHEFLFYSPPEEARIFYGK